MSVERTSQIVASYLETLVARGPYADHFAEDVTFTVMGADLEVRGRAAVEQFIRDFHERAFDAQPEIRRTIVGDGHAVVEADFVGTHTNEFFGVAPTGRAVRVPYAVVYDIEGERITALRGYIPMDALLRQIGAAAGQSAAAV